MKPLYLHHLLEFFSLLPPPFSAFASSFSAPAVSAAPKRYKRQTHNDLNLLIPGNHTSPWIAFLSDKKYIFTSQEIACIQLLLKRKAHLHVIASFLCTEDLFPKNILSVNKCQMLPTPTRVCGHFSEIQHDTLRDCCSAREVDL